MQHLSTGQLFQRAQTGDRAAFTALYHQTWEVLYQLAFNKTQDEEESKDIVQDIYIQLWQKIASLELRGSVEGYLYSMVKYEIIRRMRQFMKHQQDKYDYQYLIDSVTAPLYQSIFADELRQSLEAEISALPEKQQRILRLHCEDDYAVGDIAKEMNIAEQTVKNQLVHARRKLRASLKASVLSMILL